MNGKHEKALILLASLVAVILVSGCTSTPAALGNGVRILDFQSDFPQGVYSGDTIQLQLRVQNQGEVRATDVEAELTNIDVSEWGTFGSFGFSETLDDLIPYDSTTGTPGEIKTSIWRLEAPELPKGTIYTYEPMVKVSYNYKTVANKPITLVDEDELRRIIQQGKSLPSKPTTYTAGPLSVEIKTEDYTRTSSGVSGGESYEVFPVHVKITNTDWEGGGSVIKDGFGGFGFDEFDYPVRVKITPPVGVTPRGIGADACSGSFETLNLWQGKDAEVTCEFEVTNPPEYRQEKMITIELEYRYQTESTTSIRVSGTEEGLGWF